MIQEIFDVVVIGGGPSGFAAAVAAAQNGAKAALVERFGFCGGMATIAGMSVYINYPAGEKQLAGSIYNYMISSLIAKGDAYALNSTLAWVAVNPEGIKSFCDAILEEAGVKVFYHCMLADVQRNGENIQSVMAIGKGAERYKFSAKTFIDATGDADLAYASKVETMIGRSGDSACQPMTMLFRAGPINVLQAKHAGARLIDNKYLWWGDGDESLMGLVEQAKMAGEWNIPKSCFSLMWSDPQWPEMVCVNGTRISGYNGGDSRQLTSAEIEGRRQVDVAVQFMRKYLPGFEKIHLVQTGPQIGVRESRRIVGRYIMSEEDVLAGKKFDDQIALAAYSIDVHLPGSEKTVLKKLPAGEYYSIPYRSLLSKDVDNLLVVGRALSATHIAASSIRVMPICMTTGQAAGTAAALANAEDISVDQVDIKKLQTKLFL